MTLLSRCKRSFTRPHLQLIALLGVIVPRRLRADWRQEWEAELRYREARLADWDRLDWRRKFDLLWRSTSAFWDAIWMQTYRWEDAMIQDLRYGVRMLLKNPSLTAITVLLLALGIGVNASVFTALNGMMMRARVDKDPDSFIHLAPQYAGRFEQAGLDGALSLPDFQALQKSTHASQELAGWSIARVKLGDELQSQMALMVTPNFFSVYGLERLKLGRLFLAEECAVPGNTPVVIISEELWRNQFGADPQIIGTTIRLNRQPLTVVGITPARFSGRLRGQGIWLPYTAQPQFGGGKNLFQEPDTQWLSVDGRLRPGQSRAAAQAELDLLARQQDQLHPSRKTTMILTNGSMIEEPTLREKIFWVPWLIMGALSLVLLITCINVTLLLLARAAARQREMAIRLALGAGRQRLLRMLLTESLILAAVAGAISAWLTYQMPNLFEKMFTGAPNYPLQPDWKVFAYLSSVTLLAGCLAGLAPALESLKVNLAGTLKGTLFGHARKKWSGRELLIGGQVAMSVVLLVFAGMFVRVQYSMFTVDPEFDTGQVLILPLQAEPGRYTTDSAASFHQALAQRVSALPGVQAVCYASAPPGAGGGLDAALIEIRLPGQEKGAGKLTGINIVSADFFETFRIPIIAGRTFLAAEANTQSKAASVVVSESFAHRLWGNEDGLGKALVDLSGEQMQVVGIARDTKSSFGVRQGPQLYRQFNPRFVGAPMMIRFAGDVRQITEVVKNVVRETDHDMPVAPQALRSKLDELAARLWILVRLILLLGFIALLIAVIGIYGVVAFAVSRRTKEMGIRLALGATKGNIVRLVLRSSLKPILAGLASGLFLAAAGSYVIGQVLREMPFTIEMRDPLVYFAVALLLLLTAMSAVFGPALHAAKSDLMQALRQE